MPVQQVPDVDANGNLVTQQGQAADKKKTHDLTIAGLALGGVAVAITIFLHGKNQSASSTATPAVASDNGVGTVFPGGSPGYGAYGSGGDVLAGSTMYATQTSLTAGEYAAINQALATIATQNQAIGTYETKIGAQNQAIGTMLLTGQTPGGAKLPSTR